MDLETEADGVIKNVTPSQVRELLAADRRFGRLASLVDGQWSFLQAAEAQWVTRKTDLEGWEESYFAQTNGTAEHPDPREMFVLISRRSRFGSPEFCATVIPKPLVAEIFAQYLAGEDSWRALGEWMPCPK